MKRSALVVLLVAAGLAPGFVACEQGGPGAQMSAAFAMGRAAWAARKATCATYHYDRSTVPPGFHAITTVQIAADVPAWRGFFEPDQRDAGGPPGTSWIETGADIGSHAGAYDALTVEQLLDACEGFVAHAQADTFEIDLTDGVPHVCGWTDGGCTGSSCADQIELAGFSCGSLDPASVRPGADGGAAD